MTHKHAFWSIVSSLGLAVLGDLLFFKQFPFGFQLAIFQLVYLGLLFGLRRAKGDRIPMYGYGAAGIAWLFTLPFCLWNSPWTILGFPFWFTANILVLASLYGYHLNLWHPFELVRLGFLMPVHVVARLRVWSELRTKSLSSVQKSVLLGLCLSIPLLLIFVPLLASADAAFAKTLSDIFAVFHLERFSDAIGHVLFIGILWTFFSGLFGGVIWLLPTIYPLKRSEHPKLRIESQVIALVVSALFLCFLLVQAWYLFGGEAAFQLLDVSVTYADYAKQGFGQLCAVAFLVVLMVLTLQSFHFESISRRAKMVYGCLCLETMALVISAVLRLMLYVKAYGFTSLRLFAFASILAIVLSIGYLWYGIATNRAVKHTVRDQLLVLASVYFGFLMLGPDHLAFVLQKTRAHGEVLTVNSQDITSFGIDVVPEILAGHALGTMVYEGDIEARRRGSRVCQAYHTEATLETNERATLRRLLGNIENAREMRSFISLNYSLLRMSKLDRERALATLVAENKELCASSE